MKTFLPVVVVAILAIVTVTVTALPADLNNERISNDERHDFSSLISQKKLHQLNVTTTAAPNSTVLTEAPPKVARDEPSSTLVPEVTTLPTESSKNQTVLPNESSTIVSSETTAKP